MKRRRWWIAAAVALVLVVGLGSRWEAIPRPDFFAKYAGDTLWAVLVFLLLAFAMPRRPVLAIAGLTLAIAFGVELLQLYHAPWIDRIRNTLPGRLVLGQGFLFSDLICYTAGIGAATLVYDWCLNRRLRTLPVVLGIGLPLLVTIAVIASNVGQGSQLFGFVSDIPGRDKTGHFLLMGALSFALVLMLVPRMKSPPMKATALVVAVVGTIVALEEGSQYFVKTRTFSLADLFCSLGGIVVFGALAMLFLPKNRVAEPVTEFAKNSARGATGEADGGE